MNKLELFKLQTKEIKHLVSGQWTSVLAALAPEVSDAADGFTGMKRPAIKCPYHAAKSKTSFRFLKSGDENGACGCYTCGIWKDGFEFLMETKGINFNDAVRMVGEQIGYRFDSAYDTTKLNERLKKQEAAKKQREAEQRKRDEIERNKQLQKLCDMWADGYSLDAPESQPARQYFVNRGLGNVGTLRGEVIFHPNLPYYAGEDMELVGYFGCILSQVRNPKGQPIRIHRTYITMDGKKVTHNGESAKKLTQDVPLIPLTGASIQLSPAGTKVLGVGEGLETILAAMVATKMPVQCCINAELLKSWTPAKGTEFVFIWADKDVSKTGINRAKELQERLNKLNIKSQICEPPIPIPDGEKGVDWADAYNEMGIDAFPEEAINWYKYL
ncbi:toprim domain-containing protein [Vibrio gangliei]|uniref:toprim domain-containing protein n=1 Tax=Vibrio gangliei TaxID=2077090 RepID=UPI000D014ABC|nr:toprim domain-containing protein [Vibrio gangliei]